LSGDIVVETKGWNQTEVEDAHTSYTGLDLGIIATDLAASTAVNKASPVIMTVEY
jgi:hypothetical protein